MDRSGHSERTALTLVVSLGTAPLARHALGVRALLVGSGPDADIRLEARGVRPRHAELRRHGQGALLTPLDRECKLLLDGRPVAGDLLLRPGQLAHVGLYTLELELPGTRPAVARTTRDALGQLELIMGGKTVRVFSLHHGATVGRDPGCWVPVDDAELSERHAEFYRAGDSSVHIRDLQSEGGTRVGGRTIADAPLLTGDKIDIGSFQFRFRAADQSSSSWFAGRAWPSWVLLLLAAFCLGVVLVRGQARREPDPARALREASLALDAGDVERARRALPAPGSEFPDSLGRVRRRLVQRVDAASARRQAEDALALGQAQRAIDHLVLAHGLAPGESATTELLHRTLRRLGREEAPVAALPSALIEPPPRAPPIESRSPPRRPPGARPEIDTDPPRVAWGASDRMHLLPGEALTLIIERRPGEERALDCSWSAERGSLSADGLRGRYLAPARAAGSVDHLRVEVRAPGGAPRVLRATISIGRPAASAAADPEAERLFWSGYRLLREPTLHDPSRARAELRRALELLEGGHPLARRARELLLEIEDEADSGDQVPK